ncbi:MAG: L-2-hydroxyglutarate oxidase [Acidobacteria bacterium]|nr:L-2-hydroxyglutarate oxidase [Acidobacteriota bacterium]
MADTWDVAVIGGGIVGLAVARSLLGAFDLSVVVLEAEEKLAAHQTGNNSGVVHSGLYYRPGSLKARNCVEGRLALEAYCQERGIPWERCGKVVVATREDQLEELEKLEQRSGENGLEGVRRIGPEEIRDLEPHAAGIAGLHVPETGIVDYVAVAASFARDIEAGGGTIRTGARVRKIVPDTNGLTIETSSGTIEAGFLVACAGLQADRVARMAGLRPQIRIVPFRGEYYTLAPAARHLVHNLIYPVPDSRFPFLGVHFTRRVNGEVEAGPNAVLAFKREGYTRTSFSLGDTIETMTYPGFWKLALTYWKTGIKEQFRSLSKTAFVRSLKELIPEITSADVTAGGAGVRAQAMAPDGTLLDDFVILADERMIHVLNAPSPAATASLAIGRTIADRAGREFGLG